MVFQPGDRVLTVVKGIKGRHKLADRWKGPYIVQEIVGDQVYVIQSESDDHHWTVHRNLLRQCMFLPSNSKLDENKPENTKSLDNDHLERENNPDKEQEEQQEKLKECKEDRTQDEEGSCCNAEEDADTKQRKGDADEEEEEEVNVNVRPTRVRKKPGYLSNFVCNQQYIRGSEDYKDRVEKGRRLYKKLYKRFKSYI